MLVLAIIVFLTLFVSANCSLYEAVLYSARMGTLEAAKRKKDTKAKLAVQMISFKKNISTPISAILITNTLANTAGATVAGMYASKVLGAPYLPVFSLVFTILILFFSEIMPKNIGAVHWRTLWYWIVKPLQMLSTGLKPMIYFTERFSQLFIKGFKSTTITEDEILAMIHMGAKEGEISHEESRMVRNIIDLENKTVRDIMTPRKVMVSLNCSSSAKEALKPGDHKTFSRIPIWENTQENILGYVKIQDVIASQFRDENEVSLKSIARPISFVRDNSNCLTVFSDFLKNRKHIAIVLDEFDSISGLITLEDLIESLIGIEIVDEGDKHTDMQKFARQQKFNRSLDGGKKG